MQKRYKNTKKIRKKETYELYLIGFFDFIHKKTSVQKENVFKNIFLNIPTFEREQQGFYEQFYEQF